MKNNKGFTLVELIISMAITGLIAVAATGFMGAGARTYSNLNYALRLQYESQLAMSQLQEHIIDCSEGLFWDDAAATLYLISRDPDDDDETVMHVIRYDSTEQQLLYGSGTPSLSLVASDLMAQHITGFSVSLVPGAEDDAAGEANVSLTITRNNNDYTSRQIIALRNQPLRTDSLEDLLDEVN